MESSTKGDLAALNKALDDLLFKESKDITKHRFLTKDRVQQVYEW
jgi:hypothetical protein